MVGGDRAYDTRDFVWNLLGLGITPDIAQNEHGRFSKIDRGTARHLGYCRSQCRCKLVEDVFG